MDDLTRELPTARWHKSSLSGDDGSDCVEVAALSGGHHALRDTKNRTGPTLILTPDAWATFLTAVKTGHLD
ncbi:DUF397 domain-containing protein [Streptomyces anulatus]|uniref:DUF397 domain-containing protein n=1 Tax=Streptomyces anulatus TaxID=1892 RepID=UPI0034183F7C